MSNILSIRYQKEMPYKSREKGNSKKHVFALVADCSLHFSRKNWNMSHAHEARASFVIFLSNQKNTNACDKVEKYFLEKYGEREEETGHGWASEQAKKRKHVKSLHIGKFVPSPNKPKLRNVCKFIICNTNRDCQCHYLWILIYVWIVRSDCPLVLSESEFWAPERLETWSKR